MGRVARRGLEAVVTVLGVALTLAVVYYAYAQPMERTRFSNIFLGIGVSLYYFVEARRLLFDDDGPALTRLRRIDAGACLGLGVLSLLVTGYVEYHYERILFDAPVMGYTDLDLLIGLVIIAVVIDSTRRAYGRAIAAVAFGAVVYAFVGPLLPGILRHTGMSWQQVSREGAMALSGVYGFILGIGATWVAIFVMFAGIAKAFGAMDFLLALGDEVSNSLRSGVVQIAVVSSMIMGSLTGAAAANTATTGSFTIPMMKEQGVNGQYAAAIESVASAGGQMLPPVMGVAAFIMADILDVSYFRIIQAGLIPAALFYFSVAIAVYFVTLKFGWSNEETVGFEWGVLKQGAHFAIPFVVLMYTLVYRRFSPLSAGLYTIISLIFTMYVWNLLVRMRRPSAVLDTTRQSVEGLKQGGVDMAPLVGVLAALGIIINMIQQTGLSQKISTQMITLAGGVFIVLLLLAMVASIFFGLGMPTPAAYILVVVLVAPSLINMGVAEITTHMFVFYFAMLSTITPPVALSVAIGSKIADADFLGSCVQALRIGAPGFVIPFSFVWNNSLIYWSFPATLFAALFVFAGTVSLVVTAIGFDGRTRLSPALRSVYLLLSVVAMFAPAAGQALAAGGILLLLASSNVGRFPTITKRTDRV